MTSNIGSSLIRDNFEHITTTNREDIIEKTKTEIFELLKKSIKPEFLNRIDDLIMFTPLSEDEITQIVRLQIMLIEKMLAKTDIQFSVTDKAVQFISELGYDPQFGARPIKRVLQRYVLNELSKQIIAETIDKSKAIIVDVAEEGLVFKN